MATSPISIRPHSHETDHALREISEQRLTQTPNHERPSHAIRTSPCKQARTSTSTHIPHTADTHTHLDQRPKATEGLVWEDDEHGLRWLLEDGCRHGKAGVRNELTQRTKCMDLPYSFLPPSQITQLMTPDVIYILMAITEAPLRESRIVINSRRSASTSAIHWT